MTLYHRIGAALAKGHAEDVDLLPGDAHFDREATSVPAAVLVTITDRPEPGIIMTQRPDTMRKHAGQIAFPGGRVDPEDANHIAAALREAEEEIALPPAAVQVVGTTDVYRTITGYAVTPVIGIVAPDLTYRANEHEVADIFETPLAFLLDPANHQIQEVDWNGRKRHYYEIPWQGRRIWGATAAMIVNLSKRLPWPI